MATLPAVSARRLLRVLSFSVASQCDVSSRNRRLRLPDAEAVCGGEGGPPRLLLLAPVEPVLPLGEFGLKNKKVQLGKSELST